MGSSLATAFLLAGLTPLSDNETSWSCDLEVPVQVEAFWKMPFLPLGFRIDSSGRISFFGEVSVLTRLGRFGVSGSVAINSRSGVVKVVIRDRRRPDGVQEFLVRSSGRVVVNTKGETRIEVVECQIEIDVSDGTAYEVLFNGAQTMAQVEEPTRSRPSLQSSGAPRALASSDREPRGRATPSDPPRERFRVTARGYQGRADLDRVCRQTFGPDYRLASWSDVVDAVNDGTSPDDILLSGGAHVSWNGRRVWRNGRYYHINRANHRPNPNFLAHDDVRDHLFDLGSWTGDYRALCKLVR